MMMTPHDQLCPWCQTEIVWDPEIGPEDTCPHCFNELGEYRSVSLKVKQDGKQLLFDEDEADEEVDEDDIEDDDLDEDYEDEDEDTFDDYEEGVQRVMDTQEDAPVCTSCSSLMLFAGTRTMALGFVPAVPVKLKQPLLKASHSMKVYVCPSCFKIDHIAADDDRLAMIELLKEHGRT
jgi:DNA-directed RNA polymerase subunit RPC12/RpoP